MIHFIGSIKRNNFGIILISLAISACSTVEDIASKTWQVWSDPSIRVGDKEDQPTKISLSIVANKQINTNPYILNQDSLARSEEKFEDEKYSDTINISIEEIMDYPIYSYPGNFYCLSDNSKPGTGQDDEEIETGPAATPLKIIVFQLTDNSLFNSLDYDTLFQGAEEALSKTYVDSQIYVMQPKQFKFVEPFNVEDKTKYIAVIAFYNEYYDTIWKDSIKIKNTGEYYPLAIELDNDSVSIKKED